VLRIKFSAGRQFSASKSATSPSAKTLAATIRHMTYSKLYFGKELNELTYKDIQDFFIDEKDESDKIEFKAYHSPEDRNHTEKENGVVRTICAFLNSEGGLIVWGAPVGQNIEGKKEKIFKGELSPLNILIEKDTFIRRITDLITPSPNGIRFQPIQNEGNFVYIIEVDQSTYSPHQYKNTYYMRIDGQTKTAPHHYIEALFRKVSFPKLEGYIKVDHFEQDRNNNRFLLQITIMLFNKSKLQNEHDLYYRVIVTCGKFGMYGQNINPEKIYDMEGHELRVLNAKGTMYYNEPISNSEVIFVTQRDLVKSDNECTIMLYFGGRQSPLKISKYKLNLSHYDLRDPNGYFISIEENKFSHEASDEMEISEADRMKKILGR
jgi:hypothetical protein